MNDLLLDLFNKSFEEKTRRYKSTDAPWFNKRIKRLVSRKRRIYRQEGKSERYRIARAECEAEIKKAKKQYLEGILEKVKNSRNAVSLLSSKEAPIKWAMGYPEALP